MCSVSIVYLQPILVNNIARKKYRNQGRYIEEILQ